MGEVRSEKIAICELVKLVPKSVSYVETHPARYSRCGLIETKCSLSRDSYASSRSLPRKRQCVPA